MQKFKRNELKIKQIKSCNTCEHIRYKKYDYSDEEGNYLAPVCSLICKEDDDSVLESNVCKYHKRSKNN